MKRSAELQQFIDDYCEEAFGRKMNDKCCVFCGSEKVKPQDFKDDLSRKEFSISNLCQACQDKVFG